ncbi:MAG: galactitol-1-phosphate 5-dehydrogenase [Planctomycetota bacterium]|jgi:L-iditol 2-dehydrogenase/galactitol-1-phosphate 5-dehydrogenase|nr:galactitol-1-phosphate 5-dehydrogenase [Planctomycetota bacterium]
MKALVLEENAKLVYKDVPPPKRDDPSWLGVAVKAAGICGSDLHRGFGNGAYRHPLVMGHEFSGVVDDPAGGAAFGKGDRVSVFPLLWCGKCPPCQTGDYALCRDYDYYGSRRDGAFSEYLYVPEKNLLRVPDHVDLVHAAMAEPAAVALHGVRRLTIKPGATAAVYGAGPIGNMVAQWLRINGCRRVFAVDVDPGKLAIAAAMGLETVDSRGQDPVAAIREATGGAGADKVVEAVGLPSTFLQAVMTAAAFGEVVFLGNIAGTFNIGEKDFSSILRRELRIHGSWNSKWTPRGSDDWAAALAYMDRELEVKPLISHRPPLSEGVDIFNRLAEKKLAAGKIVFVL